MSATPVRLLEAARDASGGTPALAARLGISEAMLGKYLSGIFPVPDPLLLRALDLIIEQREPNFPVAPQAVPPFHDLPRDGL